MADTINESELDNLSDIEREYALKILKEFQSQDMSELYNKLKYAEYAEVPVDIITFIKDNNYLGKAWHRPDGVCKLFPYWETKLKELFPTNTDTSVNNVILSGARGLGKSEIAITAGAYLMYRIMCLKNPHLTLNLKPTETVAFAFMNITEALANDVGVTKFQNTIQMSPWFMARGTLSGSKNIIWNPPNYINIIIGSQSRHVIGQAIYFCLDGDTEIVTNIGNYRISDLVDKDIRVPNIDNDGNMCLSNICTVKPTLNTNVWYEIELKVGHTIKCTPNHRFMLKDGSYKESWRLTTIDELFGVMPNDENGYKRVCMQIASIKRIKSRTPKQFYDVINANPYNNFLIATGDTCVCSHNCFFDEISFIANQDIDVQKAKAIDMIDTAIGGMKTRFTYRGKNPSLLVLASSKRSEKSFLETHTRQKLKSEKENVLIVDEPVWNVRPKDEYSGKTFKVALGNRYLASDVLKPDADLKAYKDKGYKIIDVPIEYRADFEDNVDRALCDFAGVSSSDITKYIAGWRLQNIKKPLLKNPFTKDIIEVGNSSEDTSQYSDYFDLSVVSAEMKSRPLFIHLDMSLSGDKTGIAGVWIKSKGVQDTDVRYQLAFSVAVKAPRGFQVSFDKSRKFIYWLKEQSFRVKGVSTDTFQSADFAQQLLAKGYDYETISVDRIEKIDGSAESICKPYHYFRSMIYEERLDMYDSDLLTEEILGLEKDSSGRINHENGGKTGSKDVCDAVCGAMYHASKHLAEYQFDNVEDLDTILRVNSEEGFTPEDEMKAFEAALNESLDPMVRRNKSQKAIERVMGTNRPIPVKSVPNSSFIPATNPNDDILIL